MPIPFIVIIPDVGHTTPYPNISLQATIKFVSVGIYITCLIGLRCCIATFSEARRRLYLIKGHSLTGDLVEWKITSRTNEVRLREHRLWGWLILGIAGKILSEV